MCFFIDRNHLKPYRAEKDMVVWKKVCKCRDGSYRSSMRRFPYEKGYQYHEDSVDFRERKLNKNGEIIIKQKSAKISKYCCVGGLDEIYTGLHAYTEKQDMLDWEVWVLHGECVKCIIPKGARYWLSQRKKVIVTETLIFPE